MRDRRVAPVEQAHPLAVYVHVRHVEVVVLNALRYIVRGELAAELGEARRELAQPADLVALERQIVPEEVVVAGRKRRDPQVRGTRCFRCSWACTASPRWSSA